MFAQILKKAPFNCNEILLKSVINSVQFGPLYLSCPFHQNHHSKFKWVTGSWTLPNPVIIHQDFSRVSLIMFSLECDNGSDLVKYSEPFGFKLFLHPILGISASFQPVCLQLL
ncbi:hypothetical protein CHARACLAT_011805 [Characodon lateralis]|uniref:Uncharacterized protein n=1 Tax=Characodon lateralis TaxID=208331 RepID=A0ABU7DZT5_9TELE|nr:hypothetical protein [Characodon lateralis]